MNSNDLLIMIPEWFQRVLEFPEIMKAYAYALNGLDGNVKQLWDNQYIQTCDEATLSQYETLLGITPVGDLDYRRQVVLNKYSMTVPFSIGYLKSRLTQIYGDNEVEVDPVNCVLTVDLYESGTGSVDSVYQLLYDVVPAHIEIRLIKQGLVDIEDNAYVGSYVGSYERVSVPL